MSWLRRLSALTWGKERKEKLMTKFNFYNFHTKQWNISEIVQITELLYILEVINIFSLIHKCCCTPPQLKIFTRFISSFHQYELSPLASCSETDLMMLVSVELVWKFGKEKKKKNFTQANICNNPMVYIGWG